MQIEIDVAGSIVTVVGTIDGVRHIAARYRAAGADVRHLDTARDLPTRLQRTIASSRLVVWVDGDPESRGRLERACSASGVWLLSDVAAPSRARGHVTLVGGGPGDTELITVAGRAALAAADVVLYDRLAPLDLLASWAPGAELIDVGKTPGHHAVPQREIEQLLVAHAMRGSQVVRLKGGDPFVFGRGGEELIACRTAGVPVTVVPGVTSSISVPAAAGIPVTHREVSRAFTVISGHVPFAEHELEHLAGLGGTLVILMGVATLPQTVAGLARHGMRADMPLAIIERGFSRDQRTTITSLGDVVRVIGEVAPRSPAVIVVGAVVGVAGWSDAEAVELARSVSDQLH